MKSKASRITAWAGALLLSFGLGAMIALQCTQYRKYALASPKEVSIETIEGRQTLVMSFPDHPPWAHSHILDVCVDHDDRTVDVTAYYMVFHPFSSRILDRPPVVLKGGLQDGQYSLRSWDGKAYSLLGRMRVENGDVVDWMAEESQEDPLMHMKPTPTA